MQCRRGRTKSKTEWSSEGQRGSAVCRRDRYIVCVRTFQWPFPHSAHSPSLIVSSAFICLFHFFCVCARVVCGLCTVYFVPLLANSDCRRRCCNTQKNAYIFSLSRPFTRHKCFDLLFRVDSSLLHFCVYLHARLISCAPTAAITMPFKSSIPITSLYCTNGCFFVVASHCFPFPRPENRPNLLCFSIFCLLPTVATAINKHTGSRVILKQMETNLS